jgi:hypothetical protein
LCTVRGNDFDEARGQSSRAINQRPDLNRTAVTDEAMEVGRAQWLNNIGLGRTQGERSSTAALPRAVAVINDRAADVGSNGGRAAIRVDDHVAARP